MARSFLAPLAAAACAAAHLHVQDASRWEQVIFSWKASGPLIDVSGARGGRSAVVVAAAAYGDEPGVDERMEVAPANLRFVFQGVSEPDYRGSKYGGIPWRLGLLEVR